MFFFPPGCLKCPTSTYEVLGELFVFTVKRNAVGSEFLHFIVKGMFTVVFSSMLTYRSISARSSSLFTVKRPKHVSIFPRTIDSQCLKKLSSLTHYLTVICISERIYCLQHDRLWLYQVLYRCQHKKNRYGSPYHHLVITL